MEYHNTLKLLTDFSNSENKTVIEARLKETIDQVYPTLPKSVVDEIRDNHDFKLSRDFGWKYLCTLLDVLKVLSDTEFSGKSAIFTVEQHRTIKKAIEIAASIGILRSLSPQIKLHASAMKSDTSIINSDSNGEMEKYKKLSHTTNIFLELFDNSMFRAAIISQLHCLLAALLQLSHAPLQEPKEHIPYSREPDFEMTPKLYVKLKKDQDIFCNKLQSLIENCPETILVKELMVILGIPTNPKWLQTNIKHYLTERIMSPNGIIALTSATCGEVSDLGKCWNKLDITARLVGTCHGSDTEKYYNSVCLQILDLFNSKENKQRNIIANACMKALYDYNPKICIEKIINVIMEPLLVKYDSVQKQSAIIKNEDEISQCLQNLCKLFLTMDAEFKTLPTNVLSSVSLPLFYLHIKSYKSIYLFRSQVRQLLLKILSDETTIENFFAVFLDHETLKSKEYGEKLNFRFGVNGAIEICSDPLSVEYNEIVDCLFDLVEKDENLAFGLFTYLLKFIPKMNDVTQNVQEGKLLETEDDLMERIQKQITSISLLTLLSSSSLVQQAQIKNPQPLLNFIKFFFSKTIANSETDDTMMYEQDATMLYTSLLLIKTIMTDCNVQKTWEIFQGFIQTVKKEFDFNKVPSNVVSIVEEIETLIKKKGKPYPNYHDLSADQKKSSDFDKALADLADPLLPVRGHGLITLTKLIERRHPDTILMKDFLLCILQEHLSHDDSFIYLATINGLCALSSMFPEKVLDILAKEFIGLTVPKNNRDVTPETRAKLGEILVKVTRALGEVTPAYKSLLVNCFLCGTKDPDPLVRSSSLSCLGELCKVMGFRLSNVLYEILHCISCIIRTDKDDSCRRAAVLVATMLLKGLGKDALHQLGRDLISLYRSLKNLRDNDKDPVLQLHAQLALEEFADIVEAHLNVSHTFPHFLLK